MTPAQYLREISARRHALADYAAAYDRLATEAYDQLGRGNLVPSSTSRGYANIAARASDAEMFDPEPKDAPWCDCSSCCEYLWRTA